MAGPSTAFSNLILDHIFNGGTLTLPITWYLALYTMAPTDAGGGTEVSGGGYSRLSLTRNQFFFPLSTAREIGLASSGSFTEASANWGSVVAVAFFDGIPGNMRWWGMLNIPQVINAGDTFKIPAGTAGIRATL